MFQNCNQVVAGTTKIFLFFPRESLEKQPRPDVQLSERLTSLGNHVYPIENAPWNPPYITALSYWRRGLIWSPIIPRDALWCWTTFMHSNEAGNFCALKEILCNINDTFKPVIGILVNWHISTGILTRIARAIFVKIPVEVCQFTKIPMTGLKVSFMLQKISDFTFKYQPKNLSRLWIEVETRENCPRS